MSLFDVIYKQVCSNTYRHIGNKEKAEPGDIMAVIREKNFINPVIIPNVWLDRTGTELRKELPGYVFLTLRKELLFPDGIVEL